MRERHVCLISCTGRMRRDSQGTRMKRLKVDEEDSERNMDGNEKPSAGKSRSTFTIAGGRKDTESPRSVSMKRNMFPDHGGKVIDTLLSLSQGIVADEGDVNTASHQKQTDISLTLSGDDPLEELRQNSLHKLKQLAREQDLELGDGWEVEIVKKRLRLEKFFVSPSKKKFRTWPDVARHLGLFGKTSKVRSVEAEGNQGLDSAIPIQLSPPGIESDSPHHSSGKHHGKKSQALKLEEAKVDAGQNIGMHPSATLASQWCQDVFRGVISNDKFAVLCRMFRNASSVPWEKGFQTNASITGVLDFHLLSLRMSTGIYGERPELFLADLQQVWTNIHSIGNELSALASALSELSDSLYKERVANMFSVGSMEGEEINAINGDLVPEMGLSLYVPLSEQKPSEDLTTNDTMEPVDNSPWSAKYAQVIMPQEVVTEALPSTPVAEVVSKHPSTRKKARKFSKSIYRVEKENGSISSHACANANKGRACKICEGTDGSDFITCGSCSGRFHAHCFVPVVSNISETSSWFCPTCATTTSTKDSVIHLPLETTEVYPEKPTGLEHTPQLLDTTGNVDGGSLKVSGKNGLCRLCGKNEHEVLCDSCESAYHIHCLSPPLNRVPEGTWYCAICLEDQRKSGINSQQDLEHEQHGKQIKRPSHHFAVCKEIIEVEKPSPPVIKSTYSQHPIKGVGRVCKLCGVDDKRYLLCCDACSKPYHITCLKPPLKKIPTSTWYCPSCMCRICKVDTDDDKILLCDECDEGYHTYCLSPPLESIPEGSWFCPSCIFMEKPVVNVPHEESIKPSASEDWKNTTENKKEFPKRKRKSTEPKRLT